MSPLITPNVYNQFQNEMKKMIFDYLLTPEASIKQIHSQISWLKQMKALYDENIANVDSIPEGLFIQIFEFLNLFLSHYLLIF